MTSTAGSWVPSPRRSAPRGSSPGAAAAQRATGLASRADGLGAGRAPLLARMGGGRAPELRGGAVLVLAWVFLWAFFVLAVVVPAARLHAGAGSAAGSGAGEAAMARTATLRD